MEECQQNSKGNSMERNANEVEMVFDDQDDIIDISRSSVDISDSRHHQSNEISENTSTVDCQKSQKKEEKEPIHLAKKHSEPLKLLPYKQQKPKPEVRSQVLPGKTLSFASTRTTTFLNPFQPKILSPPSPTNRLLLIFISIQPIKKIQITSIHLIQRNVKHIANIHQFDDTHFVLATFQIKEDQNYRCCVTYEDQSLTRHPIAKSQPFQGASLTIIVRASLSMEEKRKSLNFAIFQSIGFLLDNVVSKTHTVQKQLFPWFNQLYTHFCRVSDQSTQKILTTLQINKKQPRNSQYFLYFFRAVYREQALDLYQQHKLQQKMTFAFVCRIVNRNYPESQQLCNFYVQVNLRFAINHHYAYNAQEIKNLVYFNMGCQTPHKIYELLMRLAEVIPKGLIDIDKDITPIFIDEADLTVAEYIKLKTKYLQLMLEKRPAAYQANCLMHFLKDLLDIAVKKHEDQFYIEEDLFNANLLSEMQRILKLPELDLPKFYSKCKILKATTRDTVNLVDLALPVLQDKQAGLIKHNPVKMVLSLLIQPTSEFDLSLLNSLFQLKIMATDHWVEVVRVLVVNQLNPYNIEYIQQKFIDIYKEIDVLKIAEALDKAMVSTRQKKSKFSQAKCTLIYRLFTIFISQTKVSNCLTLKKLLDSCCTLRDSFLKEAFLNRIFKEIQRNNSSEEYLLFVERQVCNFDAEYRQKCLSYLATCRAGHKQ